MRDRVNRSGRQVLVHLPERGHGRQILQHVEWARAQRLKGALRENLGEHVVRVGEISSDNAKKVPNLSFIAWPMWRNVVLAPSENAVVAVCISTCCSVFAPPHFLVLLLG